jgi:hypothetical protein
MFPAPPSLMQDETIIKSTSASRLGYSKGWSFSLIDRRLIFKALFYEDWFPLSHIKSISKNMTFGSVILDIGFQDWAKASHRDWQAVRIAPGFVFGHRSVA